MISANYFKALVDSLPDIVWSFDRDYTLTAANVAFYELRKNIYESEIKIGDNFFKDVSLAAIEKWKPLYERVFKGERIIIEDERTVNHQHSFVEISLNPVYDDHKEITGCMGITYDVTRIYEQEVALNQYRKVTDKFIKSTDFTLLPAISKVLNLSEQLGSLNPRDREDFDTILFMLNNELVYLNKELANLVSMSNGAKNL